MFVATRSARLGFTGLTAAPACSIASKRTYAVAATSSSTSKPSTKPPVQLFGVDGTYANALYTASAKTNALDSTDKALAALSNLFRKDAKLSKVIATPTLTAQDKSAVIVELLRAGGISGDKTVKNLLEVLAENNRLGMLESVIEKYGTLMSAYRGEVEVQVTSAERLDAKTMQRLETAIGKSPLVGQGKKLKVVNVVKPDIVGGLVVELEDQTIDLSVSSKISKLNKLLTEAI